MNRYRRKKAFIGAIVGAVGSIAGGLIGGAKQRREAKKQAMIASRNRQFETLSNEAQGINSALANYNNSAAEDFEAKLMKCGGKVKYRNRKSFGGWGDVIGGITSAAGSIASGVTGNNSYRDAGIALSQLANAGFTNKMINNNTKDVQNKLTISDDEIISPTKLVQGANKPDKLPPIHRYGGRKSISKYACGGKKNK